MPAEEVGEKIAMSPGNVSMLLGETNGLRMQTTSPALGGASLRIQGLSGRYSQILSDGLPLYGAQSGSVGILQIPPMDLAQVEVIKGVASALYGMSAIGGVVNLVSRRPKAAEHELLVNRTNHRGTDGALWLAQPLNTRWNYSILGGAHWEDRSDFDHDGWSDLPMFRRTQVRPRVSWDDGAGHSIFASFGALDEDRRGGTAPGRTTPDGQPHPENLQTRQFDGGLVGRFLLGGGQVLSFRASTVSQRHDHTFGQRARARALDDQLWRDIADRNCRSEHVGGRRSAAAGDVPGARCAAICVHLHDSRRVRPGRLRHFEMVHRVGKRPRRSSQRVRHVLQPATVAALPSGAAVDDARLRRARALRAFAVHRRDGRNRALHPRADERNQPGRRHEHLDRPYVAEGAVGGHDHRVSLEHRGRAGLRALATGPFAARIVNAETPTRTTGAEFIARYHEDDLDIIVTHIYLHSTEVGEDGTGRREYR